MKVILPQLVALSCTVAIGNSQDAVKAPAYGPAATAFDTQGNVAYNMTQAERELAVAAEQARRRKAQMYERASQTSAPPPVVPRTAAEFLAANPPPPMPEPLQPRNPIRTSRDYVPSFSNETSPITPERGGGSGPSAAPSFDTPKTKKEGGFFKLFGKKKKGESALSGAPVGAAEYQSSPYEAPAQAQEVSQEPSIREPNPAPPEAPNFDSAAMDASLREATVRSQPATSQPQVGNGSSSSRGGFLGKLFKKRESKPAEVPTGTASPVSPAPQSEGEMSATDAPVPPAPPAAPENGEIPDPAAFDEPASGNRP